MRSKFSLLIFVLSICTALVSAQSVTITPKKIVYKRTGRNVPDFKRAFDVRYPIFSGKLTTAALRSLKIGTDYWRLWDTNLAENLKDDHWLSSFDYEVKYNKHGILDIWLTIEGVGAYPDSSTKYLAFDLRTGRRLALADLFKSTRLNDLRDLIRKRMRAAENALDKELKDELAAHRELEINREFHPGPDKLELKDLDGFSIGDNGVTFIYDYGYPHVSQALEPAGEFLLIYEVLKPFIKPDGLLATFVR